MTRERRAACLRGIYAIVNEGERNVVAIAQAAYENGVRVVQYRAKAGIVHENVRAIRKLAEKHESLLIMNDDWQAAVALDCDGVHLGPDDTGFLDIAPVRALLRERLIGLSCGTRAEAERADASDIDYLGVGAVFATASKADAGAPIGIDGLLQVANATRLPVAAIGGITAQNLPLVRGSGVAMAALIAAIAGAADPARAARELVAAWNAEA